MKLDWIVVAAVLGCVGVGLGAFGAHGLEGRASPEQLEWWKTATFYHLIHVLPVLALGFAEGRRGVGNAAASAFVVGIVLFSGTLYAMGLGAPTKLGMVTPLGGLALMVGWVLLGVFGARSRRASD